MSMWADDDYLREYEQHPNPVDEERVEEWPDLENHMVGYEPEY